MKTTLPAFLAFSLLIFSCTSRTEKNDREFTFKGEINGQDSGVIVLSYWSDNASIDDTTKIKNGKFIFRGMISEPVLATLNGGNDLNTVLIYLEPRKMKILLSKDRYEECRMTGSKTQNESDLLMKLKQPFNERISILRDQKNKINESLKNSNNDSAKIFFEKKAGEIDKLWTLTVKTIDSIELRFVLENPKSFISADKLIWLVNEHVISLDSIKSIFNGFDITLKESSYGKDIIDYIRKNENIQIGALVPAIYILDINNQTINLSRFRDKNVVLIDFWASSCVPCRKSLPHLKEIYSKYHPDGLEIIAVAWLDNKEDWKEAISRENIEMWYNASTVFWNGESINEEITDNFYVPSIPFTLLIDKTGRIIYQHAGYSEESEESLDRLLSRTFEKYISN